MNKQLLDDLQGLLGNSVIDQSFQDIKAILLDITKSYNQPQVAEFLSLVSYAGYNGRFDTDRVLEGGIHKFGFKELLDTLSAVLIKNESEVAEVTLRDKIKSGVLSSINTDITVDTYFNQKLYESDFELFTSLVSEAGGRYVQGVRPGRQVDHLVNILKQDEVYRAKVKSITQEVLSVYDVALQGSFDLEPYFGVIGLYRNAPAFNISKGGAVAPFTVSRAVGDSGERKTKVSTLYLSLSDYLRSKFVITPKKKNDTKPTLESKQGKFIVVQDRQWNPALMLPHPTTGEQYYVYQPFKLAEYVYGRQSTNKLNQLLYRPYTGSAGWVNYRESHIRPNIEQVLYDTILIILERNNLLTDTQVLESPQNLDTTITEFLGYVRDSMTIMFLMIEQEGSIADWASFKLRMSVPNRVDFEDSETFLTPIISTVIGKSTNALEFQPRTDLVAGNIRLYEYEHIFDVALATGRPLFALKALDTLQARGESIDINNIILGKKSDGSILLATKDGNTGVDFFKFLFHFVIAGSRSGKGVLTYNLLAGHIASFRPLFYIDRKPDTSASIASFSGLNEEGFPNIFAINGGAYGLAFDNFEPKGILNMMDENRKAKVFKNVPDYMLSNMVWEGEFGDLVYMRAILFVLGLIQLRAWSKDNAPDVYERLNGSRGITVVIDEFSNWEESFVKTYLNPRSSDSYTSNALSDKELTTIKQSARELTQLYQKRASGEIKDSELNKIDKLESIIEPLKDERRAYYTDLVYNLSETFKFLRTDGNALFKNSEAMDSDVFIIGQNLDAKPIPDGGTFYKSNQGVYSTDSSFDNADPFASFFYSYSTDYILGYNADRAKYAHQGTPGSKANKSLTKHARGFVYTPLGREEAIGEGSLENFERQSTFFKPFLILNNGKEPCGGNFPDNPDELARALKDPETIYVGQMIEQVGIERWKEYRKSYLVQDTNTLRPETGFIEYMTQLSSGNDITHMRASLSKSKEMADFVVQQLGYSGDIYDFLFDLRPAWNFASIDIVNAFKSPEKFAKNERFKTYNTLFGYQSIFQQLDYTLNPTEDVDVYDDEVNFGDINEANFEEAQDLMNETPVKDFGATPPVDLNTFTTQEPQDIQPTLQSYNKSTDPFGQEVTLGEVIEEFDPNVSLDELNVNDDTYYKNYVDLCEKLSRDVIRTFGGYRSIKTVEVKNSSLYINNVRYAKKLPDTTTSNLPYDKRVHVSKGLYAYLFNFAHLLNMDNLVYIKFDSKAFILDKLVEDLSLPASEVTPVMLFDTIPTKGIVIEGKVYMRDKIVTDGSSIFTSEQRRREVASSTESWLSNSRRNSWTSTKTLFRKKGILNKVGGIFSLGATVTSGTVLGGYRVTREVYRGIKDLFKSKTVES